MEYVIVPEADRAAVLAGDTVSPCLGPTIRRHKGPKKQHKQEGIIAPHHVKMAPTIETRSECKFTWPEHVVFMYLGI